MYATAVRRVPTTVELSERQFARVRLTGSDNNTIVVNLSPETAEAAGFRDADSVIAESVVYDAEPSDGWLVGYGTAEKVDGRSHPNAARVLRAGGQSDTIVVGIPKAAFEEAFDVDLTDLQAGANVRLAVATAPGVLALRMAETVDVNVDPAALDDLDAQLLLEESDR